MVRKDEHGTYHLDYSGVISGVGSDIKRFSLDDIEITFNGMRIEPTYIQNVRVEAGKYTEFEITGFLTDEAAIGGEKMGQYGGQGTTLGSYGYALKCLAEGLGNAVERGWLDDADAKEEFRSHVNVVKEKDNREAYIRHLEDQIENLKAGKPALMPGVIDQRLT